MLGTIPKSASGEVLVIFNIMRKKYFNCLINKIYLYKYIYNINVQRVSRESLTRGDSQEDPVQLQRDLQDSIEREADMREQLRFSEEQVKIKN